MSILITKFCILFLILKWVDLLSQYYNKEPPRGVNKALDHALALKKGFKEKMVDEILMPLARRFSVFIKMEGKRELELKSQLARAGFDMTPKEYYSRAIAATLLSLLLLPCLYIVGLAVFIPIGVCVSGVVSYHFLTCCQDVLKKKKHKIEKGLPGFIRAILFKLNEQKGVAPDLIGIFETYLQVADPVFEYDVSILLVEMKSKNIETALRNFNNRVRIVEVSFLCNALIGVTRGESQANALETLAKDMDLRARENIRRELEKRPGKITMATLPLVGVATVTLLYVILASVGMNLSKMI